MFLLGAGSGGLLLLGSGRSLMAFRNFGLQLEARSRFSFSLTTGQSDFGDVTVMLRANKLAVDAVESSRLGGCGAIRLLDVERG